jgi:hypothetical protein
MQQLEMWRCLCALTGPDIQRIVEFAKRLPHLTAASIGERAQILLLKAHFFRLWLLRTACMFDAAGDHSLTFDTGYSLSRAQLELVYGAPLLQRLLAFARALARLHLNDIEVGLVAALVLTSLRDAGLAALVEPASRRLVARSHAELREALHFEVRNRLRSGAASGQIARTQSRDI